MFPYFCVRQTQTDSIVNKQTPYSLLKEGTALARFSTTFLAAITERCVLFRCGTGQSRAL